MIVDNDGQYGNFNSRPHEEVDEITIMRFVTIVISTHDLTRRSTLSWKWYAELSNISTHDLTRRSTLLFSIYTAIVVISTHDLTRRSTFMNEFLHYVVNISTHDLTRRSTRQS